MTVIFDTAITREELRGKRVTIVGLGKGRTTAGLAQFLVKSGAQVTVSDARSREENAEGIARLGDTPIEFVFGPSSDDMALADPELVFVIPGIRPRSATILRALQRDIPVLTEIALFFRLCPAPIVGVTGTKGKTTTTTMIERILQRGPRRVVTGGNIGRSIIQDLDTITKNDVVLLELSSFQLETLGMSPHVAVITNVSEDHIDHHGTRESYIAAKRNIVAWQGPKDIAVINLDDPAVVAMHTGSASEARGYSLTMRPRHGAFLDPSGRLVLSDGAQQIPLIEARELRVVGRHNIANALAAAVAGQAMGVPAPQIAGALREFEGVTHRLQRVDEIAGVLWVDDSAATTPAATLSALDAFDRTPVLILGGVSKGVDFAPLARELSRRARAAVLIGPAADDIASALDAATAGPRAPHLPIRRVAGLADAVSAAQALAQPGDVVLLSPACAAREDITRAKTIDAFNSADERGERFVALVRELAKGGPA
ncbi:MAG: UDP-N-acetylmuramoyl-L-alanine--D-glutamate ligase [Chloroflexi bacterium]|nr:MAG: UDP-N-acetylmuramoyl-L-alanine--D-glutamate ligase [Chloroflexota bacterium]TMC56084.1 MAG: UDP-N-acetylmuramoyl-L-alanine--D-glutamate ligase [Chloroflexota bacterium]